MKRIDWKDGGQPFFNADFKDGFDNLYAAMEEQLLGQGAMVLSGCALTTTTPSSSSIAAGICYIDGRICRFAGATGVDLSGSNLRYLVLQTTNTDTRQFTEDGQNKTMFVTYTAVLQNTAPTAPAQGIVISRFGINKRLRLLTENAQTENAAVHSITGAELNRNAVTAVIATKAAFLDSSNGVALTGLTKDTDVLNELNASTGVFTAQAAGMYLVSGILAFNFSQTPPFVAFELQIWNGSAFVQYAADAPEITRLGQAQTANIACLVKLAAGGQLRLGYIKGSGVTCNITLGNWSIARHS